MAMGSRLKERGRLVISHPLGREFVHRLHIQNPELVPHELPGEQELREMAAEAGLVVIHFADQPAFYLAVAEKWPKLVKW